jgi:hypothetical protein
MVFLSSLNPAFSPVEKGKLPDVLRGRNHDAGNVIRFAVEASLLI